jgi:hypothetical protein
MQSFVPYPPGVETIGNNEEETFGDIKVFGVDGEMLPVHAGATTQDWALDTGAVFNAPKAGFFPDAISATQTATPMPESVKTAVSAASRGANAALNAVGLNSSNLDFFGRPKLHPPVKAYYSQAPIRWGPYFGKLAFIPDTEALRAHAEQDLPLDDENAPADSRDRVVSCASSGLCGRRAALHRPRPYAGRSRRQGMVGGREALPDRRPPGDSITECLDRRAAGLRR